MRKQDKIIINSKCRTDWERLIYNWIHNEAYRKMFIRWPLDGISIEDVAEEFELSVNHCQARILKAKTQLFKNI